MLVFKSLFPLHIPSRFRLCYLPYADEDEDDGEGLRPLEDADAGGDAHRDRDDGLHVVVCRDNRGAQCALAYHRENVADEGAEHHDVCRLPPCRYGHCRPLQAEQMGHGQRDDDNRCP